MNNVTFQFNFEGTDKNGDRVTFMAKTTEKTQAKCFISAVRKFIHAFPGGEITKRDVGTKVN